MRANQTPNFSLLDALPIFEARLLALIEKINPQLFALQADHIAVRCHHLETAKMWHQHFLQHGHLLSSNQIRGRAICIFELNSPLNVGPWVIDCVELPYPTDKKYIEETWEHVELVLPVLPEAFVTEVAKLLPSESELAGHGLTLKWRMPKGEGETLANPTVAISDGVVTVKIHPYSLKEVIASARMTNINQ